MHLSRSPSGWSAEPLQELTIVAAPGAVVVVRDGAQREYQRLPAAAEVRFLVGGSLGEHTIEAFDGAGHALERMAFQVAAHSAVADAQGTYRDLFTRCVATLRCEGGTDGEGTQVWRGTTYHYYCPWILDHSHMVKGQQYLSGYAGEFVDVLRAVQRDDGMIWSFGFQTQAPGYGYHYWAYKDHGYAAIDGGILFARQAVEQHCEYNFVDTLHLAWKGNGDDAWMAANLGAAQKALDFNLTGPGRYSERFQLLKRGCTIDSWDFQARDRYLVSFPLGGDMLIDPERTKFVIFFGDNHGYAQACDQLAEMLTHTGHADAAAVYRRRGAEIRARTATLTWNGAFFRHHVEEDPSVVRDFGVDETTQVVMSNAYALNRGISHAQAVAILSTYQELKGRLPHRSPGEWYAIYPPYERGFGGHNDKWQYMNGGVQAHMAGELARGACEHGFEAYGADILARVSALAARTDQRIHFCYTGAWEPPPPAQHFTPVALDGLTSMGLTDTPMAGVVSWMNERGGNDLRGLPTGTQTFQGVPYRITDPAAHGGRAALAVSYDRPGFSRQVVIPLTGTPGAIYLVHTANAVGPSQLGASLRFAYADGSTRILYLRQGVHFSGWWFPTLRGPDAGIAWQGPNGVVGDVGVSWACIANPQPTVPLASLTVAATEEGAIYALLALTLSDRMPYHEPGPISTGGPDQWSAGLCLHALMEGVAGIKDLDRAYHQVRVSPRWSAAGVDAVSVTARYGAGTGYVSYRYEHQAAQRTITVTLTGSGDGGVLRVLLPAVATGALSAQRDGAVVAVGEERVEQSRYATLALTPRTPSRIVLRYQEA